ncbi:hypothetical protein EXIGLDRAFT_842189 [Exidia glandulosa HHB12029]|uniref:Uncharacterized protein n=1 Tax=Exidia glandulosa HHB12029 TaxID=1314781 RepID=A0A165DFA3_EXIGL|nr:hypothetical protein EXIGLDRAFT_842189 [Exidia glandulosa HHB12029]
MMSRRSPNAADGLPSKSLRGLRRSPLSRNGRAVDLPRSASARTMTTTTRTMMTRTRATRMTRRMWPRRPRRRVPVGPRRTRPKCRPSRPTVVRIALTCVRKYRCPSHVSLALCPHLVSIAIFHMCYLSCPPSRCRCLFSPRSRSDSCWRGIWKFARIPGRLLACS